MKTTELAKILGPDERGRLVGDIALYQTPSFVLRNLAEWMTKRAGKDEDWYELASRLRHVAYESEGRGL